MSAHTQEDMKSHQKAALALGRAWKKLFTSSIPSHPSPCCFKRLLLRQSSGICLQNCYVRDRDGTRALHTPLLDFLVWWKCINAMGLCHIYTTLKYSNCLKLWDISLAGGGGFPLPLRLSLSLTHWNLYKDHRKSWIPFSRICFFYPSFILAWALICWYAGAFGVKLLDCITTLASLFWSCKELPP